MHKLMIPETIRNRVRTRTGKQHPFDSLAAERTALVVIDLQNYFMKPGMPGEIGMAREIVPTVNRLAGELRRRGGHVVWIRTSANNADKSWSVFHDWLMTPDRSQRRLDTMDEAADGYQFWPSIDLQPQDAQITKTRYSAFIQGSSPIDQHLKDRGIDTVLIAGTATNVCCESSARDAMMLNYKVVMVHDALATYADEEHNASLSAFYSNFGDVQGVDEVVASLDRQPQREAAE
jgi:ureidoacrylate peracid hydrolase